MSYHASTHLSFSEDTEVGEVSSFKNVIARKARGHILPGDLVGITSGFTFEVGGARQGYFRNERIIGYGPGHGPLKMGTGHWSPRGGFAKAHPTFADVVEARERKEDEAREAQAAERDRLRLAEQAKRALLAAEITAIFRAPVDTLVSYGGRDWVVLGKAFSKAHYHSSLEYNGALCDATVRTYRILTSTETGETLRVRG